MAHEIGHNLGMYHDDTAGCDKEGFIMSPSRGTKGETQWSQCSVQALSEANLPCLLENSDGTKEYLDLAAGVYPGEVWSANRQCQIFLLDSDAHMDHTETSYDKMCYSLKCRTPKREGKTKSKSNGQYRPVFQMGSIRKLLAVEADLKTNKKVHCH